MGPHMAIFLNNTKQKNASISALATQLAMLVFHVASTHVTLRHESTQDPTCHSSCHSSLMSACHQCHVSDTQSYHFSQIIQVPYQLPHQPHAPTCRPIAQASRFTPQPDHSRASANHMLHAFPDQRSYKFKTSQAQGSTLSLRGCSRYYDSRGPNVLIAQATRVLQYINPTLEVQQLVYKPC